MFRKVWGMDPKTGTSMNALTENSTDFKYDPLYNGISLDLINEKPGGVSSEVDFGENALFKLESFQAPTLIANSVTCDPNFFIMLIADYDDLIRLHKLHEANDYKFTVYEDERHEMLTFPNFKFSRQQYGLQFKTTRFVTPANQTPWWWKSMDQRIMFQVSPRLLSSNTAYDSIAFHQSSMQDPSMRAKTGNNRNETTYGTNELPLKPFAHVYPCKMNTTSKKWEIMPKTAYE